MIDLKSLLLEQRYQLIAVPYLFPLLELNCPLKTLIFSMKFKKTAVETHPFILFGVVCWLSLRDEGFFHSEFVPGVLSLQFFFVLRCFRQSFPSERVPKGCYSEWIWFLQLIFCLLAFPFHDIHALGGRLTHQCRQLLLQEPHSQLRARLSGFFIRRFHSISPQRDILLMTPIGFAKLLESISAVSSSAPVGSLIVAPLQQIQLLQSVSLTHVWTQYCTLLYLYILLIYDKVRWWCEWSIFNGW